MQMLPVERCSQIPILTACTLALYGHVRDQ